LPSYGWPFLGAGEPGRQSVRKIVRVEVVDVDRYHREVGRIYLGDRCINLEMVRDGMAWRYDKGDEFTAAEREAREKRRGLWADPNPVAPWEYQRQRRGATTGRP
jgi:micrococcal nuclease